jgi:YHS domain-containing protein
MTTDPVCGMRVDERESEFRTQFAGRNTFSARKSAEKNSRSAPRSTWR